MNTKANERTKTVIRDIQKRSTHSAMGGGLFCNSLVHLYDDRDKRWIQIAIDGELSEIERLSYLSNPPKLENPRSEIGLCMLKVASVVNGYGLSGAVVYQHILYALRSHPSSRKPRRIEYQWRRMLKRAKPRRRVQS